MGFPFSWGFRTVLKSKFPGYIHGLNPMKTLKNISWMFQAIFIGFDLVVTANPKEENQKRTGFLPTIEAREALRATSNTSFNSIKENLQEALDVALPSLPKRTRVQSGVSQQHGAAVFKDTAGISVVKIALELNK